MHETNRDGVDVGCGWVVGWCDCKFCNSCDIDDGDLESVVNVSGSGDEPVGCGFNEFAWCENMVKRGLVLVDTGK